MSHDNRFRENDPARDLPPLGHHEKQNLAIGAIAAEPKVVHLPRRRRSGIYMATAAAAAVALALPVMQPWQGLGGPKVLQLSGVGTNSLTGAARDSMMPGYAESSKMAGLSMFWGGYKYIADVELSTEGQTGVAFEIITRSDAKQIVARVADTFNVPEPTYNADGFVEDSAVSTYPDSSAPTVSKYLYAYVGESGSNFSYTNDAVNPWRECWVQRDSDSGSNNGSYPAYPEGGEECSPAAAANLPSDAEAKQLVRARLAAWGIETSNLQFEIYRDDWQVNTYANELKDGFASPVSWSFSFVNDARIYSVYGSLDTLRPLDTYDLISPAAAIERANALAEEQYRQFLEWRDAQPDAPADGDGATSEPGNPGLSPEPKPSAIDPSVIEPSVIDPSEGTSSTSKPTVEPTFEPMPEPSWTMQTVHVTRVERGMQWVTAADGTNLWIPTYEFYGFIEGEKESSAWPMGSVIAVVDSQIDLSQFTGGYFGGVMPMYDTKSGSDTAVRPQD